MNFNASTFGDDDTLSADLKNPSYLFGTHHLAPLSVYLEHEGAKSAFESCEQVVGEIDMTGNQMVMASKMQPYMMAPADSTLSKVLAPEDYALIKEQFVNYAPMPGMSLDMFEPMKPMVVTQMVSLSIIMKEMEGFDPNQQLDAYFQKQGKQLGKNIVGLETVEHQADVLYNSHTIKRQAEDLVELFADPAKSVEEAKALDDCYFAGDLTKMYAMSEELEQDPVFFRRLLTERNNDWISKLPDIMREKSSFIAVGCMHLVGEIGLIEQLRSLGYTVEPVE